MGKELKKLILGRVLTIGGIILVGIFILRVTLPNAQSLSQVKPGVWLIFILGLFCFGLGCCFKTFWTNIKEAKLAWHWWRLNLGIFPENAGEREKLLPFAKGVLQRLAENLSVAIDNRTVAEQNLAQAEACNLSAFLPNPTVAQTSSFLRGIRKRLRELFEDRIRKSIAADEASSIYLKHWDLFKDLDMLPRKPATVTYDGAWSGPTEFRESLPPDPPKTENPGTGALPVQTT